MGITFSLIDEGTLDTVYQCNVCKETFRFNYQNDESELDYDSWRDERYAQLTEEHIGMECLDQQMRRYYPEEFCKRTNAFNGQSHIESFLDDIEGDWNEFTDLDNEEAILRLMGTWEFARRVVGAYTDGE